MLDRVADVLPPGATRSPTPVVPDLFSLVVGPSAAGANIKRFNLVYLGATRLARTLDLDEAMLVLREYLHLLVAVQAPRKLFIRATVVGWRGRALVITSDRPSGTSDLLNTLLSTGAVYYSNRYAVIDGRGFVHAYPTPFEPAPATTPWPIAEELPPLPIGCFAQVRSNGRGGHAIRDLTPAECALRLLSHTVVGRARPRFALAMLTRIVELAARRETSADSVPACLPEGGSHVSPRAAGESHRSRARSRTADL